ncbi:MAG: T9SS type A sorting domain-containing protein [Burkholderiales bacterium]|nr:T9SS type A sorting domain-containing protein [Bacteroidia bacterium]
MKFLSLNFLVALFTVFSYLTHVKLSAQNYTFSPGKTFIMAVDTSQLNYNGIRITNTSSTDLDFTWELLLKDTLIDCEFDLCNSGICFNNLPESGAMPSIMPGTQGFLKMHMFSGQSNGINTIKYVLKNAALASSDTLTFLINVGNTTGLINYNEASIKATIYPNPTVNETAVTIDLADQLDVTVNVLNGVGQVVYHSMVTLNASLNKITLDTEKFASGLYNVVIASEKGSVTKKLSVSK